MFAINVLYIFAINICFVSCFKYLHYTTVDS